MRTLATKLFRDIDKTIKLWKVFERSIKVAHEHDQKSNGNSITSRGLFVPKISVQDNIVAAIPRRIYANGIFVFLCFVFEEKKI